MGHGRLDSELGSYSIPGIAFSPLNPRHKIPALAGCEFGSGSEKEESIFDNSVPKLRFHGQWTTLYHTRFILGSYLVPTPHSRC
jgi:hypothetical protein